jgi:hypothetical protein
MMTSGDAESSAAIWVSKLTGDDGPGRNICDSGFMMLIGMETMPLLQEYLNYSGKRAGVPGSGRRGSGSPSVHTAMCSIRITATL